MADLMIICGGIKICIVEAKREDLRYGVVQGLTGSEVIAELEGLEQTLCIVTSYNDWWLFQNGNDSIAKFVYTLEMANAHSVLPTESSLKLLAGYLCSFLHFVNEE